MRVAFFSDIHGNLPALEAAFNDARERGAKHLICLGDIVGYGPQPVECLQWIRQFASATVLGNHDAAVCGLFDKARFNAFARETAERAELALSQDDRAWLRELPYQIEGNDFLCTHGSFNDPEAFDYLSECEDAALSFSLYPEASLFFIGHTHIPCIFADEGVSNELPRKLPPEDLVLQAGVRYIINPGAIGFPRGERLSADYVLFDTVTRRVSFHSVDYDLAPYRMALVNNGYNLLNYWFLSPKASRRRTELAMRAMTTRRVAMDATSGFKVCHRTQQRHLFYALFYSVAILLFVFMGIVLALVLKNDSTPTLKRTAPSEETVSPMSSPLGEEAKWVFDAKANVAFTLEDGAIHLAKSTAAPAAFSLKSPRLPLAAFGGPARAYNVRYEPKSKGKVDYHIRCIYYRADGSSVKGDKHSYKGLKPVSFTDKDKGDMQMVEICIDGTLYGSLTFEHFTLQAKE